ncbi:hypothetical protein ABNO84_10745, partial [Campylobacter jejuni]
KNNFTKIYAKFWIIAFKLIHIIKFPKILLARTNIIITFYVCMGGGYYFESPNNLEYQCKIEKDTQILSQEQIISYVKELYSK